MYGIEIGAIHINGSTSFVLYNTLLGSGFLCELRRYCCYFSCFNIALRCALVLGISLSAESDLRAPRP